MPEDDTGVAVCGELLWPSCSAPWDATARVGRRCRSEAGRSAHSLDIAVRIGGTARPGGLALAPNGRGPGVLMLRPPRRARVMAHLHEAGRSYVIAPGVEIEEASIRASVRTSGGRWAPKTLA